MKKEITYCDICGSDFEKANEKEGDPGRAELTFKWALKVGSQCHGREIEYKDICVICMKHLRAAITATIEERKDAGNN